MVSPKVVPVSRAVSAHQKQRELVRASLLTFPGERPSTANAYRKE